MGRANADVVFIPKCRRKTLYEQLRKHLGEVFRKLAEQKESRIDSARFAPGNACKSWTDFPILTIGDRRLCITRALVRALRTLPSTVDHGTFRVMHGKSPNSSAEE